MIVTPAMLQGASEGKNLGDCTPAGIERSEREGQAALVASTDMPKTMNPDRAAFEKLGFVFGEDVDELFIKATLPDGWTREATDHAMWSYILDQCGRRRIGVFYKAAFYDRRANARAERRYHTEALDIDKPEGAHGVRDCATGEIIWRGESYKQNDWETYRAQEAAAMAWLDKNYPLHLDPTAYWDAA
jgi:hypothetical protein